MALQNSDLILVSRSGTNYKYTAGDLKSAVGYTLPRAGIGSKGVLGGIKMGKHLSMNGDGVVDADLPNAIEYQGIVDMTASGSAPGSAGNTKHPDPPEIGDLYLNSTSGTIHTDWHGAYIGTHAYTTCVVGEMVLWDGAHWDVVGQISDSAVTSVRANDPIEVDNTDPHAPILTIDLTTLTSLP